MTRRPQRLARRGSLTVVLASLVVALLACEGILRLFRLGENGYTTVTLGIYAPDPELTWVLKPNLRVLRNWTGRNILIRTDADGHRVPDVAVLQDGAEQIAFAGDSYVFGHEVDA